MLTLIEYCFHRGLWGRFCMLIAISTLAAGLSIWFAESIADFFKNTKEPGFHIQAHVSAMALMASLYLLSSFFGLLSEYLSQTLSTRIAARLAQDYMEAFRIREISNAGIHDAKGEITSVLLSQMERFRSEYLMSVTSVCTRIALLGTVAIYFVCIYPLQTIAAVLLGVVFIVTGHSLLRLLTGVADRHLTQANRELGTLASRASGTVLFISLIGLTAELARQYEKTFHRLGTGRGVAAVSTQVPRTLIEFFGLLAVIGMGLYGSPIALSSEDFLYAGLLLLRFNPHFQYLLKGLAVMQTAEGARRIIKIDSHRREQRVALGDGRVPDTIQLRGVRWDLRENLWLRVNGPSGSGKTTFLLQLAQLLSESDVQVCLIQNSDDVPLLPLSGSGITWQSLRDDLVALGLENVNDRLKSSADPGLDGLSNGERQRVLIAVAAHSGTRVLMLDEGLSALDQDTLARTVAYIRSRPGLAVAFCEHGRRELFRELLGETLAEVDVAPLGVPLGSTQGGGDAVSFAEAKIGSEGKNLAVAGS